MPGATDPLASPRDCKRPSARERSGAGEGRLRGVGSFLALLSYPFVVEPFLPLRVQTWTWSIGYALFVVLCSTTAWRFRSGEQKTLVETTDAGAPPSWSEYGLWFALAALPSAMLLAVTNFLLQNVAAIPLFWIVPLALYLLSFIIAFDSELADGSLA